MVEKKPAQTKVKVVVRVRPALNGASTVCSKAVGNKVQIVNHRNTSENLLYEFSSVYNESTSQHTIFSECVEPLLDNVFHGQNVSVFAYGPTGAGKTHTMLGMENDPGIIPRVIKSLFIKLGQETDSVVPPVVSFSYMEIYNEKVQDLLSPGSSDLPIREDAHHNIFVAGAKEETIQSFDDFKKFFGPASCNRTVAATKLNEASSRSHSILQLKVIRRVKGKTFIGKIYLIDLAGSEDNRRTGNKGIRLKESGAINKSLFVLGEVVDAINNNLIRVPYRNSKLTRLLQDSIGGSCHSVMITNIAPEQHYYYDTYCTLNFATKSKKIVNVNTATIKEDSPPVAVIQPTKRRSSSISNGDGKKRRLSTSSKISSSAPNVVAGPSTNSPLVRRQAELESAVNEKLEAMEKLMQEVLRKQTRDQTETQPTHHTASSRSSTASQSTPALSTSNRRRSSRIAVRADSPDVICGTPNVSRTKLKDTTNLMLQRFLRRDEHAGKAPEVGKKLALKKKKMSQEDTTGMSCSPLFLTPAGQKRKTTKKKEDLSPAVKKAKVAEEKFQHHNQFQRDADFLQMLNTASVKELQTLQTVGKKRAQLIYDWRQLHGPFDFMTGLTDVPGFTEKFVHNLLRSNLVSRANLN